MGIPTRGDTGAKTANALTKKPDGPAVLAKKLGEAYIVIEEGQNGRTTVWDDPVEGPKNGLKYMVPCLESQAPLDTVIIMLGTNDLKNRFCVGVSEIAKSVAQLVDAAKLAEYGRDGKPPGNHTFISDPYGQDGRKPVWIYV